MKKQNAIKILCACESSGKVRNAFARRGFDAWSCDILPSETPGKHIQGDILDLIWKPNQWDAIISFYECTNTAVSGARWFKEKYWVQQVSIAYFRAIWNAPCKFIAQENPVSIISREDILGKPTQTIQPWQFGHGETKKTCLWLKGFPPLKPTNIVDGREQRVWKEPPSADRKRNRSRTYDGIAEAMAEQWSGVLLNEFCT